MKLYIFKKKIEIFRLHIETTTWNKLEKCENLRTTLYSPDNPPYNHCFFGRERGPIHTYKFNATPLSRLYTDLRARAHTHALRYVYVSVCVYVCVRHKSRNNILLVEGISLKCQKQPALPPLPRLNKRSRGIQAWGVQSVGRRLLCEGCLVVVAFWWKIGCCFLYVLL